MANKSKVSKVKFLPVKNDLRRKVGRGGLDPSLVNRADTVARKSAPDFAPLATEILARLDGYIAETRAAIPADRDMIRRLGGPVMELKANGGMFGYATVTGIADVVLDFLENIEIMDEDAFEIVDLHQLAIRAIISGRIKNEDSAEGRALAEELSRACARYYKKHGMVVDG